MTLLGPGDPLPLAPRRVLVAGTSGSGKTTLAGRIGAALAIPHQEIDALFHGPGWTPLSSFMTEVERFASEPRWVTEWQYRVARPLLAERADLVVWLDLPRRTVMRQVVGRTLRRRLRRERLWNGNVEPPLWTIVRDRDYIVRWAWRTHRANAERVASLVEERPELLVVRLRTRAEVEGWLGGPLAEAARSR